VVQVISDNLRENTNTLAPHPVYFSVDGRPASTSFEFNSKKYRVDWDGHSLKMTEYSKKFMVWHSHPVEDFNLEIENAGCGGCLILLSSIIFTYGLLFFAIRKVWSYWE